MILPSARRNASRKCRACRTPGSLRTSMPRKPKSWRERYVFYLESPEWKALRKLVLKRDLGQCRQSDCKRRARQVHHIHYRTLTRETGRELVSLCMDCHEQEHADYSLADRISRWREIGLESVRNPCPKVASRTRQTERPRGLTHLNGRSANSRKFILRKKSRTDPADSKIDAESS